MQKRSETVRCECLVGGKVKSKLYNNFIPTNRVFFSRYSQKVFPVSVKVVRMRAPTLKLKRRSYYWRRCMVATYFMSVSPTRFNHLYIKTKIIVRYN
jgi:hypothetical protein